MNLAFLSQLKKKCIFLTLHFQQGVSILSGQCIMVLHCVKQHNDATGWNDEMLAEQWKFGNRHLFGAEEATEIKAGRDVHQTFVTVTFLALGTLHT